MKNILILVFFGCAVFVSNIFTDTPKASSVSIVLNKTILNKELEKRTLLRELNALVYKNTNSIDSLKIK
jgi:hypothetical protein